VALCENVLRSLKFYRALFLIKLVLSKFGCPVAESSHPDLIVALPVIMKNGGFFSYVDGLPESLKLGRNQMFPT
jgi:hypothetical protein